MGRYMAIENNREGVNLRERVSQEVSQGFTRVGGTVGRHVSDVVGDEIGPLVEDIQSLAGGISSLFAAGMGGFQSLIPGLGKDPQEDVLDENEKQTSLLDKIWGYFSWKRKKDARTFDGGEEGGVTPLGLMGVLGAIFGVAAGSVAAIVGGVVKSITLPFEVLGKSLTKLTSVTSLFNNIIIKTVTLLNKTKLGTKLLTGVERFISFFTRIFTKIGSFARMTSGILSKIPLVSSFLSGFTQMFTKIAGYATPIG